MFLRKLFGVLFVVAAIAGFVLSAYGLVEIWRFRPVATQSVVSNLALFDQALITTQEGLTIVGQVVQTTSADVTSLQTTIQALAQAIHDTNPMLNSLTKLTGKDFPEALAATHTSLASAQSTALLIDNILAALTSIPFSPVAAYKPAVPLHTALEQVSASLDPLTPALTTISTSLAVGKTNMSAVEKELTGVSETTKEISSALADAQGVVAEYQAVVDQLKARVETLQQTAPAWITRIAWILSILLGWLLIAQLGLGSQGLDMLRTRPETHGSPDAPAP